MCELRGYYRRISGWLPCGGRCKRKIMDQIREQVNGYLAEHPGAELEEIEARFGTPREIAASYVSDMDTGELLTSLRIRRRVLAAVMAAVFFVVVTWSGCVLWAIDLELKTAGGHTEDALIEGEWQEGVDYSEYFK